MRPRKLLTMLFAVSLLVSCVAPQMVVKEGDREVVQMDAVRFLVPRGFDVVDVRKDTSPLYINENRAVLYRAGADYDTVIIVAKQYPKPTDVIMKVDLAKYFPDAYKYEPEFAPGLRGVFYLKRQPLARNFIVEEPVCKTFTVFKYGSARRYRIDVYQNFRTDVSTVEAGRLTAPQTRELEKFVAYSSALVKENLR